MRLINFFLVAFTILFVLLIGYWAVTPSHSPIWTGFGPYDAQNEGPRSKTLWDWLDLLVVPVFLALGAYLLSLAQKASEMSIELDRQRQTTLSTAVERISQLMLEKRLKSKRVDIKTRSIARTYTRLALRELDGNRKAQLLQFLRESELISTKPIISLVGADLTNSNLSHSEMMGVEIKGARFSKSHFKGANLSHSDFCGSDFSNTTLDGASLIGADLSFANFTNASLRNLDLTKTNLEWANLNKADLSSSKITEAQLEKLESKVGAKLPKLITS